MADDHFAVKHMLRNGEVTQLITTHYRYNLRSKMFEQEGQPLIEPWNGNDVTWNQQSFCIHRQIITDNRQLSEPFLTVDNFLKRFGLTIWRRPRSEQQLYVFDHESGQPLRQLTGITEFGNANTLVSPSGQFLAGVKPNEGNSWINNYSLILYEIPHHLWERSLRAIMYLSWLLILPWPFRYLIRPVGHAVRAAQ